MHYRNTLKADTLNGDAVEKLEVKEEEDVKEEMMLIEEDAIKQEGDDEEGLVTMEDMESADVGSREKWACPQHYIHLFYDDQDKAVECVLTQQLLEMRKALESKFPGHNLYQGGKKPAGFARLLLAEWRRHYPASQENTKTISMKIGRYDRAPALLASQDTKAANGRINWSPAMLDTIRSTRERAAEMAAAAGGGSSLLTKLWRQEWEAAFPDLRDVDWRQVVSRYHYHFGAERRESGDGGVVEMRGSLDSPSGSGDEEEDIRGFRQWSASMQEDLVILRDTLLADDPNLDPDSKVFSRRLLQSFQARHPACLESARSLLSKLREGGEVQEMIPSPVRRKKPGRKPAHLLAASPTMSTPQPPPNPALQIVSDIEGFTDWNLGMVRDFISCMDRARRKYSDMKEVDPQMKLVPLLLSEWQALYPVSEETVKTFLVRIRFLKTNKESIKQRLGQHGLLPKMSQEEGGEGTDALQSFPPPLPAPAFVPPPIMEKFVWQAETMMPIVISTRQKAIAKQKREQAMGRRVSYAKIWIKEFQKVFPNCPYTANNLSVHYWYWTSKDQNKEANREREGKLGGWRVDQLEELRRVGSKVEAMLEEGEAGGGARSMGHAKLLHSVWLKLHPESQETEESLAEVMVLHHHEKNRKSSLFQVLVAARQPQTQASAGRPGRKRTVLPLATQQVSVILFT